MREKFNPLIQSCSIQTIPAEEINSTELAADKQVSWFLKIHPDCFILTRQLSSTFRDLGPSGRFHGDIITYVYLPVLIAIGMERKKGRPLDTLRYRSGLAHAY
jgi:hypothetical protein